MALNCLYCADVPLRNYSLTIYLEALVIGQTATISCLYNVMFFWTCAANPKLLHVSKQSCIDLNLWMALVQNW